MLIRALLKLTFCLFCLALIVALVMPPALYQYGKQYLGDDITPAHVVYSDNVNEKFLLWLGANNATEYRRFNPYSAVFAVVLDVRVTADSRYYRAVDLHLISLVNRVLSLRAEASASNQIQWLSANFAGIVHISRNYTKSEMISTALGETHYGRALIDLDSAAQLYFGLPSSELNDSQLYSLFLLSFAPNTYDLWCNAEKNTVKNKEWVEARNIAVGDGALNIAPAPADACDV